MSELKKDSVERTLCIPLWSRAIAVKKLPQILPDHDAVRILREMGETKPPTVLYNQECGALAGAIRQYDFACEIREYLKDHPKAVIVELGAGLSCLRRQLKNETNVDQHRFSGCNCLPGEIYPGWKTGNDYIKKTGNHDAELHFSADNGGSVAAKCGMMLVEERPFFGVARKQLKKKLKLYTRIAMKVVDEGGRRGFLTHLCG